MRILVCGGRRYAERGVIAQRLDPFVSVHMVIIHGGASGADTLADEWAWDRGIRVEKYRADWNRWGKAAGPMRNQQMIDKGKPDLVLAFPGGRGTADMVRRAREAGIEVQEIKK